MDDVFRVGYLPIADHVILAITKFKVDNGHEVHTPPVEIIQKTECSEIEDALINGEIDIAFMPVPCAMNLYYMENKIKLLLLSHRNGSVIVTNKNANIRDAEDFRGKVVLIPHQASIQHIMVHKFLAEEGLFYAPDGEVMAEVAHPGQILEMIENDTDGQIAGYMAPEPYGTVAVNSGLGDVFKLSGELLPGHLCCGIVARDEIIKKYPDEIAALVKSFVQSGLSVKNAPSVAAKIAAPFLNQPDDLISQILEDPFERIITDRLMPNMAEFDIIQDYLFDYVPVPAISGKIDIAGFVDLSFAQAAGAK